MKEVKIRRCGAGWACCDGDCENCPSAHATVSTTTTLSEDAIRYTDRTSPYGTDTTPATSNS